MVIHSKHTALICVGLRSQLHHRLTPLFSRQRLQDSRRHAPPEKSTGRLDREVQTTPTDILGFTMATEAVVSVGTMTEEEEEEEEVSDLRERLSQSEKENVELQETLTSKE